MTNKHNNLQKFSRTDPEIQKNRIMRRGVHSNTHC